ncbi:protein Shroom1 [Chanos chanos]|uniref:Protein Shroom1-like n=1 Tax=Chanos chanos TaxID=29144 RepID=A0A6J2WZH4_CHACN|nr:protein Shroom1-like [Chanos chanos]XP_030649566.1 protein Shroom1-like [Chanos chanos]XP_030649567.1 protein Shroom1-like [Chanos chanos]
MDSFNFYFERMSSLDLHHLSLPVSRLSPAKSTSSIDQYSHHHGKGDSAYSSFSGGSTAPDYPSPFPSDELQPHSFHYADLKYVKAVYNPNVIDSDSSIDKLYRSMEAISQHYRQDNSNDCLSRQDPPPSTPAHPTPPPPPARLDSFITIRNLENSRVRQSPEGQVADLPYLRSQVADSSASSSRPDSGRGHRIFQQFQRDQLNRNVADKTPEPQKSASVLSRFPPRASQPGHPRLQQQQVIAGQSENLRKRAHTIHGHPEQQCAINSWHPASNTINGNIQHKGPFYFVTGTYKSPECNAKQTERPSEDFTVEHRSPAEREQCRSVMDNMVVGGQHKRQNSRDVYNEQDEALSMKSQDENHPRDSEYNHAYNSENIYGMEQSQKVTNREIGRYHTTSHPIFYCGPEESVPSPPSNMLDQANMSTVSVKDQTVHQKKDDQLRRNKKEPFGELSCEKINKETTPLLYHLTGANRAALMNTFKNRSEPGKEFKNTEWTKSNHQKGGKEDSSSIGSSTDSQHSAISKEGMPGMLSDTCNTLDDSFKKYYKEKLKDAQCKVLRETSFKRKDLQVSCSQRVKHCLQQRPSVLPTVSQETQLSLEDSGPSQYISPGMDKENVMEITKDCFGEIEERIEREIQNVAQPQVARIGGRKRLTAEQKKLSNSEPEKLHHLADGISHATCHSLDNETEGQTTEDTQGLVAARRKVFEMRGRALSASSISKTSLKHLQHKALVAYMERKTGNKGAESQQPIPQVPSQRHSTAGRPLDFGSRAQPNNMGSKKKQHRPLSAGRILDSSMSSVRYAQFSSAQPSGHTRQSSWKETLRPYSGKSASVENLLDQPEAPGGYRARSTSTPHTFQVQNSTSIAPTSQMSSHQRVEAETAVHKSHAASVPDERRVRMVSQRGKSMEELGVTRVSEPLGLSKSSEQLDQLLSQHTRLGREKRAVSVSHDNQAKIPEHTFRKPFLSQGSTPLIISFDDSVTGPRNHSPSQATGLAPSTQAKALSSSPASSTSGSVHGDTGVGSHNEQPPPPAQDQEYNDTGVRSISMPSLLKGHSEGDTGDSKIKTVAPPQSPTKEFSSKDESETENSNPSPNLSEEVCLSPGVTTDRSLWVSHPEANEKEAECSPGHDKMDVMEDKMPLPSPQGSEHQRAHSHTVPDFDVSQGSEEGREVETKEPELNENPVGEAEGMQVNGYKDQSPWEVLVEEVLSADQSLARALRPVTNRKTALMLMEQLLSEDTLLMEEHYKTKQTQKLSSDEQPINSAETAEDVEKPPCALDPTDEGVSTTPQAQDTKCFSNSDITEKKRQLIARIEERLRSLEESRSSLLGEEEANGARGNAMEALVRERCVPAEHERYMLFVGDLERVVSLLLCLSARLARVQNALSTVDEHTDAEEKQSLDNRHRLLCKQREDAKDLKDNLDRRERVVSTFLSKHLTESQFQEYRRFVQTKASLLIRQKDLDERRQLGEEQLEALLSSLSS